MIEKLPREANFVGKEQCELVDVINELIDAVNRLENIQLPHCSRCGATLIHGNFPVAHAC